jgi:hypothetical protein
MFIQLRCLSEAGLMLGELRSLAYSDLLGFIQSNSANALECFTQ